MKDEKGFNDELHRRIRQAVSSGAARVVNEASLPQGGTLIELLVSNARAKRPLLEGMTVYRGSKDPDVDAGTFDPRFKHATPDFSMARGYAETANNGIGLVSKGTLGLGMLAEYELPENAVFHRNFGYEAPDKQDRALTVAEAQRRLEPMVEAYLAAREGDDRRVATAALETFCAVYLYELPVPAEQKPVRQWVVQHDELRGGRLLEHQDRGPLADVMIDVVRARKSAVDEHLARKVSVDLQRGGRIGLDRIDTFLPGMAPVLSSVGSQVDAMLSNLREQTFSTSHASLSEAIVWRKETQKSIRLSQLTNSGFSIEHENLNLQAMPLLRESLEAIEMAAAFEDWRPKREAVFALVKDASATAMVREARHLRFEVAADHERMVAAEFDRCKTSRGHDSERLNAIEQLHSANLKGNFFTRVRYRFGQQKQVLAALSLQESRVAAWDGKLAELSAQCAKSRAAFAAERAGVEEQSEKLRKFESQLKGLEQDGDLSFLPEMAREKMMGLNLRDWTVLVDAAALKISESGEVIAKGHSAAALLRSIAAQGLEAGVANRGVGEGTANEVRASGPAVSIQGEPVPTEVKYQKAIAEAPANSAFYGWIEAPERDADFLRSLGAELAPYDYAKGLFRVKASQEAVEGLAAFRGSYSMEMKGAPDGIADSLVKGRPDAYAAMPLETLVGLREARLFEAAIGGDASAQASAVSAVTSELHRRLAATEANSRLLVDEGTRIELEGVEM